MKRILDTSVVLKWFVDEKGSNTARGYLQDFIEGKSQILFPTLLFYELGNACLQNSIPVGEIGKIIELLQQFRFEIVDIGFSAFRKIYQNASDYDITFYDVSYVTLMQKYDCELVTADKALYNRLKKTYTRITLLH